MNMFTSPSGSQVKKTLRKKQTSMSENRNFRVSHQTLCIRKIDFEYQTILGYTELIIWPLVTNLRSISLNCKQCRIYQVLVAPVPLTTSVGGVIADDPVEATFAYNDPLLEICKKEVKQRRLDTFEKRHETAVEMVDPDFGNGELTIKLSSELWPAIASLSPVKVMIEFALQKPTAGLYFVVPPDGSSEGGGGSNSLLERGVHMFTSVEANSSRLWFPCLDSFSEPCTWKIEITVEEDLTAIACGELLDTFYTEDLASKTYHFYLSQPVAAPNIALAAGAFEIHTDPYMAEVTYFCPPRLLGLLRHTVTAVHDILEFYEEILSARYPFSSFKAVFVDHAYDEHKAYSSFALFSVSMLHSSRIIEQTLVTRKSLALAVAEQFFGCFLGMQSWCQAWLPIGIAGHLAALYQKKAFGNNEYRHLISDEMRFVTEYEHTKHGIVLDASGLDNSNLYFNLKIPQVMSPSYMQAYSKKAHLIIRMLELRVGQAVLLQVFNKLMVLASLSANSQSTEDETADDENKTEGTGADALGAPEDAPANRSQARAPKPPITEENRANLLLSTRAFVKIISTVTGQDIQHFIDQWVTQPGHVRLVGKFLFNKKRNVVELELKQDITAKGATKYAGPINVILQELDGSFNHTFKIEDVRNQFDITCHSKSRKHKKKKIPLCNGEEVDMDLSRTDTDSPVLWLRIDVDMTLLCHVYLVQIDYMWQLMLRYEPDCVGQRDAVNALVDYNTHETRSVLSDIVVDNRVFYRVRMDACFAHCQVTNSLSLSGAGMPMLLHTFQTMFGTPSCKTLIRQNNFTNFQTYFLQKTIPRALATLRTQQNVCPKEVLTFLVDLLKYNDNSRNRYVDSYYKAELILAMKDTLTPAILGRTVISVNSLPSEARIIIEEVTRCLNMERLMPSYKMTITVSCLSAIRKLQKMGFLPIDPSLFYSYAAPGSFYEVRLAALEALVDHVRTERDSETLNWILTEIIDREAEDARLRYEVIGMLIAMPLFQRQEKSPMDREALVERLWLYMTTGFPGDSRVRCAMADLYHSLYGRCRPLCMPIPEGMMVVNVKEGRSLMHVEGTAGTDDLDLDVDDDGLLDGDDLDLDLDWDRSPTGHGGGGGGYENVWESPQQKREAMDGENSRAFKRSRRDSGGEVCRRLSDEEMDDFGFEVI